jgi:methylated-DNA-[protein]-cysteine S-methyltransferase
MAASEHGLRAIFFAQQRASFLALVGELNTQNEQDCTTLRDTATQMREYFSRLRRRFELSLDLQGTPFQQSVWHELLQIPYGTTVSYGEIARRMGRPPGAARAVGAAVGANPVPVVIPCHRVVGADSSLVGFGGGLEAKRTLLRLEGVYVQGSLKP